MQLAAQRRIIKNIASFKTLVRDVGSIIGASEDMGAKIASMSHLAAIFEVEGLVALREWGALLAAVEVCDELRSLWETGQER